MMGKLIAILVLAFVLRIYGINWDGGFHLHPDERMLIMVAERVHFFDQLNPQFFNYGSLPIYILKGMAQLLGLANYKNMLYLGRFLSLTADITTVFLIYKIAQFLFKNEKIALFSSLFYALAFFPIQNSHFFISDVFLTFKTTLLMFFLVSHLDNDRSVDEPNKFKQIVIVACLFAAMIATKFTAIIFLPIIYLILIFKPDKKIAMNFFMFHVLCFVFFFIFMPYAFLNYKHFLTDISAQIKMNSDPYIFPYTLQYVGTLPYFYYLKNIFLWGLGPVISLLVIIGMIFLISKKKTKSLLFTTFCYLLYFLVIGRSAVKFMRYMLPIYPFFVIIAGYGLYKILNFKFLIYKVLILGSIIWTLLFINIYSQPNTRISATNWILKNIPAGKILAVEHWDDRLPLYGEKNYQFVEMTLYDQPDDERKWMILNEKLKLADYIIISSNRLYTPLQKLADCQKYKVCYPKTAQYYKKLFNEQLGFKKVAEFTLFPSLPLITQLLNYSINLDDQSADESFTVYDHPKIMIFKKTRR